MVRILTPAGASVLPPTPLPQDRINITPDFLPLGSFGGRNGIMQLDAFGTVGIQGGTAGCTDDIVNAQWAVFNSKGAVVAAGPIVDVIRQHQFNCATAPTAKKQKVKRRVKRGGLQLDFPMDITFPAPYNTFIASADQTYTVGIQFWDRTDDAIAFTWDNILVDDNVYLSTFATIPAGSKSLGNRVNQRVDASGNYYVLIANATVPGSILGVVGQGRIEIGGGSGHDTLKGQLVIKEGYGTDGTFANNQRTIYTGPLSADATRDKNATFNFSYSSDDVVSAVPNGVYSVYIKLYVNTDDTIRVYWSNTDLETA